MSSNAFEKNKVISAAKKVLNEIAIERHGMRTKYGTRKGLAKWLTDVSYEERCIAFHRGRQEDLALSIIFKTDNCNTTCVNLDTEEVNSIRAQW